MGRILCATRGGEGSQKTQDAAIALAKEREDELIFFFVADDSFLNQTAAPVVVDVELRLERMGRFALARAQQRAATHGIQAQAVVRRGRLQGELVAVALDLDVTLIVIGSPGAKTAIFEEETLPPFAATLQAETGVEVLIV